jgi:transposase
VKKQKQLAQDLTWHVPPLGRPKIITDEYVASLQELVQRSPKAYGYPFRRWTATWLRCHLAKELGIQVSDRHVNRLLKQMGLSTRQNPSGIADNGLIVQARRITIKDLDPAEVPNCDWPFN